MGMDFCERNEKAPATQIQAYSAMKSRPDVGQRTRRSAWMGAVVLVTPSSLTRALRPAHPDFPRNSREAKSAGVLLLPGADGAGEAGVARANAPMPHWGA